MPQNKCAILTKVYTLIAIFFVFLFGGLVNPWNPSRRFQWTLKPELYSELPVRPDMEMRTLKYFQKN